MVKAGDCAEVLAFDVEGGVNKYSSGGEPNGEFWDRFEAEAKCFRGELGEEFVHGASGRWGD